MGFTRLTEVHLPSFIYLIDTIKEEEYDLDFKEIADRESKTHEMVVPRSIDRAFELREKLISGWEAKKPGRPQKKTLDVLTAFLEGNSKLSFLDYTIAYKKEIEIHYEQNKPEQQWIDILFGRKQNKASKVISEMEDRRDDVIDVLEDFSLEDFKKVLGPRAKEQLKLLFEEWKNEELEPLFEIIVQKRLKRLEDKIIASRKLYRRFGLFSLLLLPKDDELLFEEDLFTAIHDYQMGISDGGEIDESMLEAISEFGN